MWEKLIKSYTEYWDALFYTEIATKGYEYPQQNFFPLLPIIIRLVNQFTGNIYLTTHTIHTMNGILLSILFYQTSIIVSQANPAKNLILFLTYPGSIFIIANYAEGILATCVVTAILFIEHKKYLPASILIGLASGTKLVGIFANTFLMFSSIPIRKKLFYMSIGSTGLILYMIYLGITENNPFLFASAQKEWCKPDYPCTLMFPLSTIIMWIGRSQELLAFPAIMIDLFYTLIGLIILSLAYKKIHYKYILYALAIAILWLSTSKIISMTRYLTVAIPVFLVTFDLIKNSKIQNTVIISNFILQLIHIGMFSNYIWVG